MEEEFVKKDITKTNKYLKKIKIFMRKIYTKLEEKLLKVRISYN